jgi:hypothetical protein
MRITLAIVLVTAALAGRPAEAGRGGGYAPPFRVPPSGSPRSHAAPPSLFRDMPILLTPELARADYDAPVDATKPHWHYWRGFWTRW